MSPKGSAVQIVRKVEAEKPTSTEAFLTGFLLLSLVLGPLMIAFTILVRLWEKVPVTDTTAIYIGLGIGLLISFALSFVFMKLATK